MRVKVKINQQKDSQINLLKVDECAVNGVGRAVGLLKFYMCFKKLWLKIYQKRPKPSRTETGIPKKLCPHCRGKKLIGRRINRHIKREKIKCVMCGGEGYIRY